MRVSANVETLNYDVLKMTQSKALDTEYLSQAYLQLEKHAELITGGLAYDLNVYFKKIDGRPLKVPSDWWQHFKLAHAPKWFVKRWPVVFTVHTPQALFLHEKVDPGKYTRGGVLYCFTGLDGNVDRELTSGEKLHKAFEMLIKAANCLREISRDTENGISQFAKTYEEHIIKTLVNLNAPEYFLGGRVVKMTDGK